MVVPLHTKAEAREKLLYPSNTCFCENCVVIGMFLERWRERCEHEDFGPEEYDEYFYNEHVELYGSADKNQNNLSREKPESLELHEEFVAHRLYNFSERRVINPTRKNALRIMTELVNAHLEEGHRAYPLKNEWIAEELGITVDEAANAKRVLSKSGLMHVWRGSVNIEGKERNTLWATSWKYVSKKRPKLSKIQ